MVKESRSRGDETTDVVMVEPGVRDSWNSLSMVGPDKLRLKVNMFSLKSWNLPHLFTVDRPPHLSVLDVGSLSGRFRFLLWVYKVDLILGIQSPWKLDTRDYVQGEPFPFVINICFAREVLVAHVETLPWKMYLRSVIGRREGFVKVEYLPVSSRRSQISWWSSSKEGIW